MKSAGEVLRHAREKQKLSIQEISQRTAISPKFIDAIDNDAFHDLPNDVSTNGFLTLYAQTVGLDPKAVIALYRRDVTEKKPSHPTLQQHFFVFGHKRMIRFALSSIVTGIAIGLLIFAGIFLVRLKQAPPLSIQTPQSETRVASPVFIRGRTASDAMLSIDGEPVGVNQDGVFSKDLDLDPGIHIITIKATGRNGKDRNAQLVLTVE